MKKLIFLIGFLYSMTAISQTAAKLPILDKSPMDMTYFPSNYPVLKIQDKVTEPLIARIIYSRPQKSGRIVFGELVEFNKIWRLGANEATEIEFYRDVKIDGKKVVKGKYTIYALVNPTQWTIIFNKETDTWGAFKYNEKKDVVRMTLPVQKNAEPVEAFTMMFDKTTNGMMLHTFWDDVKVSLPIMLK